MDTKHCNGCNEDKQLSEFYFNKTRKKYYARCKVCDNESKKQQRLKGSFIKGMVNRVTNKPNTYKDPVQKHETFEILQSIGWKFNETNGIWYDNKIKDKNGKWLVQLSNRKRNYFRQRAYSVKREDTNRKRRFLPIDKIPKLTLRDNSVPENIVKEIMIQYFHHCNPYTKIQELFPDIDLFKIKYIISRSTTLISQNGPRTNR